MHSGIDEFFNVIIEVCIKTAPVVLDPINGWVVKGYCHISQFAQSVQLHSELWKPFTMNQERYINSFEADKWALSFIIKCSYVVFYNKTYMSSSLTFQYNSRVFFCVVYDGQFIFAMHNLMLLFDRWIWMRWVSEPYWVCIIYQSLTDTIIGTFLS